MQYVYLYVEGGNRERKYMSEVRKKNFYSNSGVIVGLELGLGLGLEWRIKQNHIFCDSN